MELIFVTNEGIVLRTYEEKLEQLSLTVEQNKLTYHIENEKWLKFDVESNDLTKIKKSKGGIYFLYNKAGRLLNVGQAREIYTRIYSKWCGKIGGSIADEFFYTFYAKFKILYIESEIDRKLCEIFFINIKQPPLNCHYAYYDTWVYKFMTTEYSKTKERMYIMSKGKNEGNKANNDFFGEIYNLLQGN